jgi:signal transduction histidine kinase
MVRAGSSPGDGSALTRPSPAVWILPPAAVTLAWIGVLVAAPTSGRWAVVGGGLVSVLAVGVLSTWVVRRGQALVDARRRQLAEEELLRARLGAQEAQLLHLAHKVLPLAVDRIQRGDFVEDILRDSAAPDGTVTPEYQAAAQAALRTVLEAVDAEEALRESAQRAFVNIARRVQAIVHRQAQDLRMMEDQHGEDPAVFDDLLRLDHGNALVGRLADSIAVLGGARPGRQWGRAVPLYSVLRGAMSRILDYHRVELHPVSEVAVVGPAVEPLIHALAELLDNATRYSPPHTRVHLTAAEVQSGIAVEIEDGGLSLSEEGRARAERMLREAQAGIDLTDLGETPRLGLAVVGRLARANGFQVSLRPSAYGGVRAVLIVPQALITSTPATGVAHGIGAASGPRHTSRNAPSQRSAARPAVPDQGRQVAAIPAPAAESPASPSPYGEAPYSEESRSAATGLPQRRRRALRPDLAGERMPAVNAADRAAQMAGGVRNRTDGPGQDGSGQDSVEPGLWLTAFQGGVSGPPDNGAADHPPASGSGNEDSAGVSERGDH